MTLSNAYASVAVRDLQTTAPVVVIKDPDRNSIAFARVLDCTAARGTRS